MSQTGQIYDTWWEGEEAPGAHQGGFIECIFTSVHDCIQISIMSVRFFLPMKNIFKSI